MKHYKAVKGSHLKDKDAEVIGPELERLAEERGGRITAADVLGAATTPESPLHAYFEWDDSAAAKAYRLDQARYIVRSIRVLIEDAGSTTDVRALHLVVEQGERSYASIDSVIADSDLLLQLVATAKREQEAWFNKYQQLRKVAALGPLFDAIERVIAPAAETENRSSDHAAE